MNKKGKREVPKVTTGIVPLVTHTQIQANKTRRNRAGDIERTDRFKNIDDGLVPYTYSNGKGYSSVSIRDAVVLCQKAYYNVAIFKNTIDLMTEFCIGNIFFKGGNKESRKFFTAFLKTLKIHGVQDRYYRELFRSGNVLIYRMDGSLKKEDVKKLTQIYGNAVKDSDKVIVPLRYVILNPADIEVVGSLSFDNANYRKVLNAYELQILRKPETEEQLALLKGLPPEVQKQIKNPNNGTVLMPLDPHNLIASFYKKQDYEPFAVPMGYPVLEDINWKMELKKIDMAVARTTQQAILLITMGAEPDKGGINMAMLNEMQKLFENESVGRVLISDYTTKASFVIPDIADILNPQKYEQVDKDINVGLNNMLVGGEKFANQSSKVQLFIEKLEKAREQFLAEFLIPEIKRIAKNLGFKNFPNPYYKDIDLKDDLEYSKLYVRLSELGILTPEETLTAIQDGKLPNDENSVEAQREFKTLKDEGLYEPLLNSPKKEDGRPPGTKAPQTTKKVAPIGASANEAPKLEGYSMKRIHEHFLQANALDRKIEAKLLKKHKLKELSEAQNLVKTSIRDMIVANENPSDWDAKINDYLSNPENKNTERLAKIDEIAAKHGVNQLMASILFYSEQK